MPAFAAMRMKVRIMIGVAQNAITAKTALAAIIAVERKVSLDWTPTSS